MCEGWQSSAHFEIIALNNEQWEHFKALVFKLDKDLEKADGSIMSKRKLGGSKYITVSQFKGKACVDVREYYKKDGKCLPGNNGCALNREQWANFKTLVNYIEKNDFFTMILVVRL